MSALGALEAYSDSDSDAEDVNRDKEQSSRCENDKLKSQAESETEGSGGQGDLMFNAQVASDGRIRSFPHVEGNYAGFVFVSLKQVPELQTLAMQVFDNARKKLPSEVVLHRITLDEMHISLSRTLVVKRHQIQPLVNRLRKALHSIPSFHMKMSAVELLSNEEGTRSFVCMTVRPVEDEMLKIVKTTDEVLRSFKLQPYYEDMHFHASVAWFLGGVPETLEIAQGEQFPRLPIDIACNILVQNVQVKLGNKKFQILLKKPET